MQIYQVRVTGYRPYPVTREYAIKASGWGVGINRAVKRYLREMNDGGKRRVMKNLTVSAGRGVIAKAEID